MNRFLPSCEKFISDIRFDYIVLICKNHVFFLLFGLVFFCFDHDEFGEELSLFLRKRKAKKGGGACVCVCGGGGG